MKLTSCAGSSGSGEETLVSSTTINTNSNLLSASRPTKKGKLLTLSRAFHFSIHTKWKHFTRFSFHPERRWVCQRHGNYKMFHKKVFPRTWFLYEIGSKCMNSLWIGFLYPEKKQTWVCVQNLTFVCRKDQLSWARQQSLPLPCYFSFAKLVRIICCFVSSTWKKGSIHTTITASSWTFKGNR